MWASSAAAGDANIPTYWNTLGSDGDSSSVSNLYLFTGVPSFPVFRNSDNSNASLNPNLGLSAGTYVIQFAGVTQSGSFVGLNLYFDEDLVHNRISAVVPYDGASNFSVISAATSTIGEGSAGFVQAGSGSLSWSADGFLVTLTSFSAVPSSPSLVGSFGIGAGGANTVASATLTVAAIPEPANYAFACALAVAAAAANLRGRKKRPRNFAELAATRDR